MSIIEPEGRTIGPEPVEAAPEPAPVVEEAPVEPEAAETETETFDRKYVESLRDEAAKYRTRSRDYEQTFGQMPEDVRAGWLQLIEIAQSGDPAAIQTLGEVLGFQAGQAEPEYQQEFLTREDAANIARQEAFNVYQEDYKIRAHQEQISSVVSEAEKLGYDTNSPDYTLLLDAANRFDVEQLHAGESLLAAADRQVKAYKQAQYDEFIAGKEAEARNSPQSPSGNGVAPAVNTAPRTWEQARDSLHERLSNL